MFEKATKTVREVGENVIDSAKKMGNSIYSSSKEQSEIAGMKVQKSVIEKRLQESYAIIGKRYVEYIRNADLSNPFDVSDVIEDIQPDMEKLDEIEAFLLEKELNAKKLEEERRQKKAVDSYETEKSKLDKALEMDIISQEEYDEKMAVVQKKLDNFEQLRKIDLQLQMGIITRDEYEAKVDKVLS